MGESGKGLRVLVVEHDEAAAAALARPLRHLRGARVDIAPTAATARAAIEASWDAFVVAVELPDDPGTSLLGSIRRRHRSEPIVLMSERDVGRFSHDALLHRAMIVAKPLPALWYEALEGPRHDAGDLPLERRLSGLGLSYREVEVLSELSRGATAVVAGLRLGISASTVRSHCQKIYARLGAGSLTEVLAMANGWDGAGPM